MTTRWTPLQRTRRKRRAAERDAPMPWDRSVTRLAEQPARRLCAVAGWGAVPSRLTLESQALRALHTHRPRPASSRPVPGRRSGVNAYACNITAPSATLPQSLAGSLGGSSASRPSGSQKGRLCLAPRPDGARSRCAALLQQPACALALSRQREGLARRSRAKVENEPRPPRAVCCARLRPCGPPFACSQPSLPSAPQAGLPEVQRQPRTVGRKLPPFAQGA
jgi:hypothetical protein